MRQDDFDQYLALLSDLLRVDDQQRREIANELRDHLETRTEELVARGLSSMEARHQALNEFGEASHLAVALTKTIHYQRRRRWMMRTAFLTTLLTIAVGIAVVLWQPQPRAGRSSLQARQESAAAAAYPSRVYWSNQTAPKLSQALDETVTEPIAATTLVDWAAYLHEQLDANVLLDRNALDSLGLDGQQQISLGVIGIPRRRQIELALSPFDLVLLVNERGMTITSQEESEAELVTGMHPVWDLIAGSEDVEAAASDLIEIVSGSVAPDTWEKVGGPCSVEYLKGLLVMSQTAGTHDRIARLLEGLRRLPSLGQGAPADRIIDPAKSTEDRALNVKLDQIMSLRVADETLEGFAQQLATAYKIPVYLDEDALDGLGLDCSAPISFDLRNVPLREILAWPLRQYDLVAFPDDGVLVIASQEEMEARGKLRIYAMQGLIDAWEDSSADEIGAELEQVKSSIMATIQPDTWEPVGGLGTISAFAGRSCLIVDQTDQVHREIESFLDALARAPRQRDDTGGGGSAGSTSRSSSRLSDSGERGVAEDAGRIVEKTCRRGLGQR